MPSQNDSNATTTDTIVLIHGLWMTPRSWEHWIPRYESRGFRVLAPAYPGLEVEVEALRADPSPIEKLTIDGVADHYEAIIRGLDKPPIIIGHSFGGTLTQILLDRGVGAAGVCVNSALVKASRSSRCPRSSRSSPSWTTRLTGTRRSALPDSPQLGALGEALH